MLRLKDVPPEQMPEVVRIASELYAQDERRKEQDQERSSYVSAAEELGVPKEYLERAAEELHRRRVGDAHQHQGKRKTGVLLAAGLAVGLTLATLGLVIVPSRTTVSEVATVPPARAIPATPAAAFEFETFDSAPEARWSLDRNAGTQAGVTYEPEAGRGQVAVIRVDRFTASSQQPHRVNFDSQMAPPTAAQQEMNFAMRGQGLSKVRVYLEQGEGVRWRSDELTVPAGWTPFRINLRNFQRQVRDGRRWRNEGAQGPDVVTKVSFKFGDFMNPPTAAGEVRLDEIRFE